MQTTSAQKIDGRYSLRAWKLVKVCSLCVAPLKRLKMAVELYMPFILAVEPSSIIWLISKLVHGAISEFQSIHQSKQEGEVCRVVVVAINTTCEMKCVCIVSVSRRNMHTYRR
jgi:hypothetical protein